MAFAQLVGPITVISELDRQRPDDLRGLAYSSSSRSSVPPVWLLHARDHFKALHLPAQGTGPGQESDADRHDNGPGQKLGADADDNGTDPAGPRQAPRLPYASMPSNDELHSRMQDLHQQSRRLHALPPSRLWPTHWTRAWTDTCTAFAPLLKAGLDSQSDLVKLQTLLDFLELPSRVFCPLLEERQLQHERRDALQPPPSCIPDPLPSSECAIPEQVAAEKRANEDLWATRCRYLSKPVQMERGTAPASLETLEILQRLHPKRHRELRRHAITAPQVQVTTKLAKDFLYRRAADDRTCIDVFGWASDFLFPVRATPFLLQVARLTAKIGSGEVPDSFGVVLTAGGLLALHKLPPQEQAARERDKLDPKYRPINVGCKLLQWGFKCALYSKPAVRAAKAVQQVQMGLGVKHGVAKTHHLFTALWHERFVNLGVDFTNGFNELLRQSMLDAIQKRVPELTGIFNLYYARDSPCYFTIDDAVHVIWSQEGSRQGCVLGSFGFDLFFKGLRCLINNLNIRNTKFSGNKINI